MGSLISWLTNQKRPKNNDLEPQLAKPTTWIDDYGMSTLPSALQAQMDEARRKLAEKEEARRREDAFPYYYGGSGYGGAGGAGGSIGMGGWSGGISSLTDEEEEASRALAKKLEDAILGRRTFTTSPFRPTDLTWSGAPEKKKSCTIPGCKTQCTKHNDYGGFICDDHYKTWKENNA